MDSNLQRLGVYEVSNVGRFVFQPWYVQLINQTNIGSVKYQGWFMFIKGQTMGLLKGIERLQKPTGKKWKTHAWLPYISWTFFGRIKILPWWPMRSHTTSFPLISIGSSQAMWNKSGYKPSGPSGQSLSKFSQHEVSRSIWSASCQLRFVTMFVYLQICFRAYLPLALKSLIGEVVKLLSLLLRSRKENHWKVLNRRFHGSRCHLGSGANTAKFTVNVWEKSWFWCLITRGRSRKRYR